MIVVAVLAFVGGLELTLAVTLLVLEIVFLVVAAEVVVVVVLAERTVRLAAVVVVVVEDICLLAVSLICLSITGDLGATLGTKGAVLGLAGGTVDDADFCVVAAVLVVVAVKGLVLVVVVDVKVLGLAAAAVVVVDVAGGFGFVDDKVEVVAVLGAVTLGLDAAVREEDVAVFLVAVKVVDLATVFAAVVAVEAVLENKVKVEN